MDDLNLNSCSYMALAWIFYSLQKRVCSVNFLTTFINYSIGEIGGRCWMVLVKKIVIQLNCTDLERWLWLVVIHLNPLHFHVCFCVSLLIISCYPKAEVESSTIGTDENLCFFRDTQNVKHTHSQHISQFAHDSLWFTRCWLSDIHTTFLLFRWAVGRHHQPRDVINCCFPSADNILSITLARGTNRGLFSTEDVYVGIFLSICTCIDLIRLISNAQLLRGIYFST